MRGCVDCPLCFEQHCSDPPDSEHDVPYRLGAFTVMITEKQWHRHMGPGREDWVPYKIKTPVAE